MKKFYRIAGIVVFTVLITEGLLRIMGIHPGPVNKNIRVVKPVDYILPDSILGWRLNKGTYITYIDGKPVASHCVDMNGNRVTSSAIENKPGSSTETSPKKIFLFGCSYTFGYTVSDSNTYPYYLQSMLPSYSVVNKAVPGYALVQMYLSLKREVESGNTPDIAVLNYATFQDQRNALGREWVWSFQSEVSKSNIDKMKKVNYPYGRLTKNNSLIITYRNGDSWYEDHPLRDRSALLTLVSFLYNHYIDHKKMDEYKEISFLTGCKVISYCKEHHIRLLFTGMDKGSREMLERWKAMGAETLLFDINVLENGYNNGPADPIHPSPKAHKLFAKEICNYMANIKMITR